MRYIVFLGLIVTLLPALGTVGYFVARLRDGGPPNAFDLVALTILLIAGFSAAVGIKWYRKRFHGGPGPKSA